MSTPSVAPALVPTNGGHSRPVPLSAVSLAWLAEAVDRLHAMRAELRAMETRERELTRAVLAHMTEHGLPALRATAAVATVTVRSEPTVDPELFIGALGIHTAAPALRVLVEKARGLMGADDLAAISETVTRPTLRLESLTR
jgi:hypothetical protein